MRCLAARLLLACLPFLHAAFSSPGVPAEEKGAIYFPVYLSAAHAGGPISFTASAGSFELEVLSSSPMDLTRPLLVVLDPASCSMPELRRRIGAVVETLAAELSTRPSLKVRIGIPALEGILFDPPVRAGAFSGDVVAAVMRLIPDTAAEQESDPGRILELTAGLLEKAQADGGAVDCMLVAKDRSFGGEEAEYLRLSAERRTLEVCCRKGSVFHGYLEGDGALRSICTATGGMVFRAEEQARSVIRQILGARDRGRVLEVQKSAARQAWGRFDLAVRAEDKLGTRFSLRAPIAVWQNADDSPAPGHNRVGDALDWIRRAQKTADGGDLATALRCIDNATQLDSWNPDAFYLGARYASEMGDLPRAAGYLSPAIRFVPPLERALLLYGEVFQKLGRSAQALETIKSLPPADVPQSPRFRLMAARLLSLSGRDEEAADLYRTLMGSDEDGSQIRAEYGCLVWRLGKEAAASEQLQSALTADPRNVTAMLCLADMAGVRGKIQEALDLGSRAALLQPENPDVHAQLGKIQAQAHEWESALESFQTAAKLSPTRTDILLRLAEAEVQSGRGPDALETMRRLLAVDPSDASAWHEIAGIYARAGQSANAASVLEQSAARFADKASTFYREAAGLREREGEYGQALLDYRTVLESAPPDRPARLQHEFSSHLAYLSLMVKGVEERYASTASPALGISAPKATQGILVPGGLSLLANMVGMVPSSLTEPDAAGRVFSAVLESIQPGQKKKSGALQGDVAQHLQDYEKLLRHMQRKGLLPPSNDRARRRQFVFPLVGDKPTIEEAKRFLSFFGVKYSLSQKDGKSTIVFTIKQDAAMQERQRLLFYMGIDIEDKKLRELRFALGDERLPSIFDAPVLLDKILGLQKVQPEALLAGFVLHPDAMRLYTALENCPAPLREALVGMFSARELAGLTDILGNFGRFLEFREGRLILPGSERAWEDLVGSPCSNPRTFLRAFIGHKKGRLFYTYFALSSASPGVRRYFTAFARRLDEFAQLIAPNVSGRADTKNWQPEVIRIIRILSADIQGLSLPVDHRFGAYLLPNRSRQSQTPAEALFSPLRLSAEDLAALVQESSKTNPSSSRPVAGTLELLKYIQDVRPRMLTDDCIEAIMRNPAESAIYLDLIWDLDPPADVLVKYLTYCRELAQAGDTGWNVNRTRTSQSVFRLVSAICREGIISKDTGWRLLQAALAGFDVQDEPAFLLNVATFLADVLLPELGRATGLPADAPGLLLEALAGRERPQSFLFDGTPLVHDASAEQLQRMSSAIRQQRLTPLSELLDMIQITRRINLSGEAPVDLLQSLAGKIIKLPALESSAAIAGAKGRPSAQSGYQLLAKELESLALRQKGGGAAERMAGLMKQVAGVLHAELGITLLAHCYAYHGTSQTAALTYDPDFIRKHEFYRRGRPAPAGWLPAELEQGKERGSLITGSLSGLGIQLHTVEMGASAQSFGTQDWSGFVPAMLSGMRAMPRSLRSERAQEYVALTLRLGRELLASRVSDPPSGQWCDQYISMLLSPLRRERLDRFLSRGSFSDAVGALSPSELFLLGEAYLVALDMLPLPARGRLAAFIQFEGAGHVQNSLKAPEFASPALDRLREIIPREGSPALDDFQEEVEQYGPFVWRRFGLTANSLRFCDSYEQPQDYPSSDLLFGRVFDLKIRLAEVGYSVGLPASIGGDLAELAIQSLITDPAAASVDSWSDVVEQIGRLGPWSVRGWIQELLNLGTLSLRPGKQTDGPEEFL